MIKTITEKSWFTGRKLVELLKILPFEIFDFLKLGLQAYSRDGMKIINLDSLERRRRYSYREILKQVHLEQGDYETQFVLTKLGSQPPPRKKLTEKEIEQKARIRYKLQLFNTPVIPEGCIAISFTPSMNEKKREEQIEEAMDFQFKRTDIEKFQDKHPGLFQEVAVRLKFVKKEEEAIFPEKGKSDAEDAISHGYIALDHLPYIMAKEEGYAGILPKRWKKYQLGLRGPKEPEIKTEQDRVSTWQALFYRWAFGKVRGVRDGIKGISFLPVHSRNEVTGKLEEYDLEGMDGVCYVKLDELGKYLTKIVKILLPPELFPNHKDRISSREPPPEKIELKEAIKYKDIIDKYKTEDFQLVNIIREELFEEFARDGYKAKLQPYSPASLQRIKVRDIHSKRNGPIFEEDKLDPNYSKDVGFVGDLLPRISECLCKQSEVEETLRKYDLCQEEEIAKVDISKEKEPQKPIKMKKDECLENPALIQLVKEATQDIKIIYSAMIKDCKTKEISFLNSVPSDLQQVAIDTLDNPEYSFKRVKEKYLKDSNFFTEMRDSSQPRRYFREHVLQQIIKENTHKKDITISEIRELLKKI